MATDIILNDEDRERITLAATSVKTTAADLLIDSPARHTGKPGLRRALVHDVRDGLTVNFNGDYPGGLTLLDTHIRLRVHRQVANAPFLPKRGEVGDLYAVQTISPASTVAQGLTVAPLALAGAPNPAGSAGRRPARGAGAKTVGPSPVQLAGFDLESATRLDDPITLWLCVRGGPRKTAYWREIPLGDTVKGTGG